MKIDFGNGVFDKKIKDCYNTPMGNQAPHSPWTSSLPKGGEGGKGVNAQQAESADRVVNTLIKATPAEALLIEGDGEVIRAILEGTPSRKKQREELLGPIRRGNTVDLGEVEELPIDGDFIKKLGRKFYFPELQEDDPLLGKTRILTQKELEFALSIGEPQSQVGGDENEGEPSNEPTNPEVVEENRTPNVYFGRAQALGSESLVPGSLRYFGKVELFGKILYRYQLNGREYLSAFPKNRVTKAKNGLYTLSLIWEKRDDTYIKCHILVFPTQEQEQLKKLRYL